MGMHGEEEPFVIQAGTLSGVPAPAPLYRDGSIGLGSNDPLASFRTDDGEARADKYEEVRTIGTGSYGAAVLVKRKDNGQLFVTKQIKISGLTEEQRRDARNEVDVLSNLDHPNIIRYYECFLEKGMLHIVMEYAQDGDLYGQIQKRQGAGTEPFSEEQIMFWFVQICLALKHVHSKRMLHRDLKTQNVFCAAHNIIKLGDFGIAKVLSTDTDMAQTVIGTPYYLSPEICEDKPYNAKSDVWSLGCVLYEMTTLKHAFDGQSLPALVVKILRGKYPPIPVWYSSNLKSLIASMLKRNPRQRPSIEKILSLTFVRGYIECYCDHIQTHIIDQGWESTLSSATVDDERPAGAATSMSVQAPDEAASSESLADVNSPLETIMEGTLERTEGAEGTGQKPSEPSTPDNMLAKARQLVKQKSAARNQEWLQQREKDLQSLGSPAGIDGAISSQGNPAGVRAQPAHRFGSPGARAAVDPVASPTQRPVREFFSDLVEAELLPSSSPSSPGGAGSPSGAVRGTKPNKLSGPGGNPSVVSGTGRGKPWAAVDVGAAVRKARATRMMQEAQKRNQAVSSKDGTRGLKVGPSSCPVAGAGGVTSVAVVAFRGIAPAARDEESRGRHDKIVAEKEEYQRKVKKAMVKEEVERQRRQTERERIKQREAELAMQQAAERRQRQEDLIKQQEVRKRTKEAELEASRQQAVKHKEAIRNARPRCTRTELVRQFSGTEEVCGRIEDGILVPDLDRCSAGSNQPAALAAEQAPLMTIRSVATVQKRQQATIGAQAPNAAEERKLEFPTLKSTLPRTTAGGRLLIAGAGVVSQSPKLAASKPPAGVGNVVGGGSANFSGTAAPAAPKQRGNNNMDRPVEIFVPGLGNVENACRPGLSRSRADTSLEFDHRGQEEVEVAKGSERGMMTSSVKKKWEEHGGRELVAVLSHMRTFLCATSSTARGNSQGDERSLATEDSVDRSEEVTWTQGSTINAIAEVGDEVEEIHVGWAQAEGALSWAGARDLELPKALPALQVRVDPGATELSQRKEPVALLLGDMGVPMSPMSPLRTASGLLNGALGTKIEALRVLCEKEMGQEVFMNVYHYLRDVQQSEGGEDENTQRRLEELLGHDRLLLARHVYKLIMYEDDFFDKSD